MKCLRQGKREDAKPMDWATVRAIQELQNGTYGFGMPGLPVGVYNCHIPVMISPVGLPIESPMDLRKHKFDMPVSGKYRMWIKLLI